MPEAVNYLKEDIFRLSGEIIVKKYLFVKGILTKL